MAMSHVHDLIRGVVVVDTFELKTYVAARPWLRVVDVWAPGPESGALVLAWVSCRAGL